MQEADVILTPMPQVDGKIKNRPAIVLRTLPPYGDCLVCGVSTQLQQHVPGFDDLISPSDPDFVASGLRSESVIRLGFLIVLPSRTIIGSIGVISIERHERLLKTLSDYLVRK
jgi:mRNA interferase MazF